MKTTVKMIVLIAIFLSSQYIGREAKKFSQHNKLAYDFLMVTDFIGFQQNGGGFGYENYWKWAYAKWRADPKRTVVEKILFWDVGVFFYAKYPPEEYQYPFLGLNS